MRKKYLIKLYNNEDNDNLSFSDNNNQLYLSSIAGNNAYNNKSININYNGFKHVVNENEDIKENENKEEEEKIINNNNDFNFPEFNNFNNENEEYMLQQILELSLKEYESQNKKADANTNINDKNSNLNNNINSININSNPSKNENDIQINPPQNNIINNNDENDNLIKQFSRNFAKNFQALKLSNKPNKNEVESPPKKIKKKEANERTKLSNKTILNSLFDYNFFNITPQKEAQKNPNQQANLI